MSELTLQVFEQTAASYDAERARLIPGYERLYGSAIDLLPAKLRSCVDLGAGTGLLAEWVLRAHPEAEVTLLVFSRQMLAQAQGRFAGRQNVHFRLADYTQDVLPAGTDAVVSALSIHHLEHEAKRALFRRIAESLAPGGVFINADQVTGPTRALQGRYRSEWLRQVRELGASETQIEQSLFRQQADRCASVEDQLAWMRECFVDVDCWYKDGCFAVMFGRSRRSPLSEPEA